MTTSRLRRRATAIGAALAMTPLIAAPPQASADWGPVNAAGTYKWGPMHWKYSWEEAPCAPVRGCSIAPWQASTEGTTQVYIGWKAINVDSSDPTLQGNFNNPSHGSAETVLGENAEAYGRWEVRIKTSEWDGAGAPYRAVAELVPASGDTSCGAQNIALGAFTSAGTGARAASVKPDVDIYARAGGVEYAGKVTNLKPASEQGYHTFAVEVRRKKVTWFLDAKARASARIRTGGVPLVPRLALEAPSASTTMQRTRMQFDWIRHYTLKHKGKKVKNQKKLLGRTEQRPYRPSC